METIKETVGRVLTATRAPSTKALPNSTIYQRFKKRSRFQTLNNPELEKMLEATARFASSINYVSPYWLTLAGVAVNETQEAD